MEAGSQLQLWCFGYDMDNMKARCWYDHSLPVFTLSADQARKVQGWVLQLLSAARDAAPLLRKQIREAWYRHPENATGDITFIDSEFWQTTEAAFYRQLHILMLAAENDQAPPVVYADWATTLARTTEQLFDQFTLQNSVEDLDLARVVKARHALLGKFHGLKSIKLLKDKGLKAKEDAHG